MSGRPGKPSTMSLLGLAVFLIVVGIAVAVFLSYAFGAVLFVVGLALLVWALVSSHRRV